MSEPLESAHFDALVATSPENIAYITGFRSLTEAVSHRQEFGVFTRRGAALVVPAGEASTIIADAVDVDHVVCFGRLRAPSPDPPSPEARRLQDLVAAAAAGPAEALAAGPAEALAAALEWLGASAGVVFDAAVQAIRTNGLPGYEPGDIGHGIGLEPRERPELASGNGTPLELGEVLRIDALFEIASMGVSVKETVLVTRAGARVLDRSHHGLIVLD